MLKKELIFVYNADAGLFSQMTDFAHKVFSPDTYQCNLCKITYGSLTMKKEWQVFINKLDINKTFLHRDEFINKYNDLKETKLPAIFIKHEDIRLLVSAEEINNVSNISELKEIVKNKIENK